MFRFASIRSLARFISIPSLFLLIALSIPAPQTVQAEQFIGGSPIVDAPDAAGCWSGEWNSCKTGHHGVLRATISPCGDGTYRAEFRGRFFKVFPFRYSVVLHVVAVEEGALHLAGSQNLGRLFGTFHFTAVVTSCRFEARYSSCKDSGTFSMGR